MRLLMLGTDPVFVLHSAFYEGSYIIYRAYCCGLLIQVNLSVATETTAELERLLQDLSAPAPDSNK